MLASGRGSSVPLVAQIPPAAAPRYSSAPETLIADAPSAGSAREAATDAATSGVCEVTVGSATGAVCVPATEPPVAERTSDGQGRGVTVSREPGCGGARDKNK